MLLGALRRIENKHQTTFLKSEIEKPGLRGLGLGVLPQCNQGLGLGVRVREGTVAAGRLVDLPVQALGVRGPGAGAPGWGWGRGRS